MNQWDDTLLILQKSIYYNAKDKGFHDNDPEPFEAFNRDWAIPRWLMLTASELAKALEAHRNGNEENFREEIADAAIRLFDLAEACGFNLGAEIERKHNTNQHRPRMHGGKRY
jgi:NTP pyrophosphatase (non-canonical NTP hydrolase)